MTRAQLLTGTLLDGASPLCSVGCVDMLGLSGPAPTWDAVTPEQVMADVRRAVADLGVPDGYRWQHSPDPYPRQLHYGGRASGKTDRQRRLAGLRSDTIPRVIVPA